MSTTASKDTDYSFQSEVTGKDEFHFEMEGMKAKVKRVHDDSTRIFDIQIEEKPDHVDVEINVGRSIVVTGNAHGLVVGNAPSEYRKDSMVAHIYNLHHWEEITDQNMAVGMAYDGTWMDGAEPCKVRLTGEEKW
jgi:hypothetical protein